MGLIKNKPPPIPIERTPNAKERLLTKYLGVTKYGGKKTKEEPNPKIIPYVTMIRSMLFTCEVSNKALEQMTAPIITVVRGPNRLVVLATNVLKIPRPTIASDPTSAEEKKEKGLLTTVQLIIGDKLKKKLISLNQYCFSYFIVTIYEHITILESKYN